jgi:hypothetical protein
VFRTLWDGELTFESVYAARVLGTARCYDLPCIIVNRDGSFQIELGDSCARLGISSTSNLGETSGTRLEPPAAIPTPTPWLKSV